MPDHFPDIYTEIGFYIAMMLFGLATILAVIIAVKEIINQLRR